MRSRVRLLGMAPSFHAGAADGEWRPGGSGSPQIYVFPDGDEGPQTKIVISGSAAPRLRAGTLVETGTKIARGMALMVRRLGISTLTIVALLSIAVGSAGAGEPREVHPSGIVKYHAVKGAGRPGRPGRNPN